MISLNLRTLWRRLAVLRRRIRRDGAQRLDANTATEREQAIIRVFMGGAVILYMLASGVEVELLGVAAGIRLLSLFYLLSSLALLIQVVRADEPSASRRYVGILLDLSCTTAAMAVSGEAGAPLLGLYLWIIVGNGFRFGVPSLVVSAIVSFVGFSGVIVYSEYWSQHPLLGVSYLLILILIPAYVAALLTKLRRAMHRAREASAHKSQFLAKMSHELRTPLNGVIGMSDLLMDSSIGSKEREFVKTIHRSGKTLLAIIDNVLDFSKIEAGRLPIQTVEIDIHQLVAEAVSMFSQQAQRKGITLTSEFDYRAPFSVLGDALHIRQVLMNLIGNAVKFTDVGSVVVRVKPLPERHGDDRLMLHFEVEDSGIGIAAEDQIGIFESFRQANADTARRFGGTGLGTAIARELVHLMGGRIGLHSQLGVGSLFWFELPLELVPLSAPDADEVLSGERALVVGRGEEARRLLNALSAMGLHADVTPRVSGATALMSEAIDAGKGYGLVLVLERHVDPNAPPTWLHGGAGQSDALHFLVSAKAAGDTANSFRAGFDGVLTLPLRREELRNAVHAARSLRLLPENVVSLVDYYRRIAPVDRARLHVLVAEDNEINRQVLRAILERAGHRLTVVDDGEAALDALQGGDGVFDLMILDKGMPGRSGLSVFQAQRFMYPQAPIPTIILSADATEVAIRECLDAGVDAYLTKPVESRRLLETIARLAENGPGRDAPGETKRQSEVQVGVDPAAVDREKLRSLRQLGEDSSFFSELVSGFRRDAERSLLDMADALKAADYPALRSAIHALEGSAKEMGATGLAAAVVQLRELKPFELQLPKARERLEVLRACLSGTLERIMREESESKEEHAH